VEGERSQYGAGDGLWQGRERRRGLPYLISNRQVVREDKGNAPTESDMAQIERSCGRLSLEKKLRERVG